MKFDVEKRMYSSLLENLLNSKNEGELVTTVIKMKTIEEVIKAQGDAIITIVSTRDTYVEGKVEDTKPVVKIPDMEVKPEPVVEPVVVEPSPQCEKCKHKMISHTRRGCRFCDCEEKRPKK